MHIGSTEGPYVPRPRSPLQFDNDEIGILIERKEINSATRILPSSELL